MGAFRQPAELADNAAGIVMLEGRRSDMGQLEPAGVDSLLFLFGPIPIFGWRRLVAV